MAGKKESVEIQGKTLPLSNLDKVLYPAVGFTKAQVIDYYARIAPVALPHLKDRPLTLKRYPEGVNGFHFYEKNAPKHRPDWVETAHIWSAGNNRWIDYVLCNELATLVWTSNLADLELHTSLSKFPEMQRPTMLAFDLDPGPPADIVQCCEVALWVRGIFERFGMQAFPKTSGSKGMQVYVPLNTAVTYEQSKPFAHAMARLMEAAHPEKVVSEMKKSLRTNKIFVDWSQNDDHKTTVNVYSLRAKDRPTVSTPITWDEVEKCLKKKDAEVLVFTSDDTLKRVEKFGDLFEPVLKLKQKLPSLEKLDALRQELIGEAQMDTRKPPKPTAAAKARAAKMAGVRTKSRKAR
ncbi:MAG: ATP-dependent DNA ligase [Candidatus Koribacter versatilis]|uniref:ATP-dependent DNA ligase n=1 Tax=Candidatus Korobacter versatilis TaxID=658062 RepID=A0A932EPR9_9BACT|nr:ATP-dependent DNA ligase [Candidatus Koribacter versatilis]